MAAPIHVDPASLTSLAGKTVLITGASSGIGLETAELFYSLGCNVAFICGRKRPPTDIPLDSPRTLVRNIDISSWDPLVSVFEDTIAKFGQIDIVCPNAGVAEPQDQYFNLKVDESGRPLEMDMRVFDVDMKGTSYTVALGMHYMKEKGGCICIMSSMAGYVGVPEMPNYSATKHGATALLRSLSRPAAQRNIALSLVAPSLIFTPGTFPDDYKPGREAYLKMREALAPTGLHISSSRTCALAVAYLVNGGLAMAGKGLLVDNDEINDLELDLHRARPEWFAAKAGTRDLTGDFLFG